MTLPAHSQFTNPDLSSFTKPPMQGALKPLKFALKDDKDALQMDDTPVKIRQCETDCFL